MTINFLLLTISIIINGLATGIETSTMSLDRMELKRRVRAGDKRAKRIYKIRQNPTDFLATTQICVMLTSLLASAFAADAFANYFMRNLVLSVNEFVYIRTILIVGTTLFLSYITLVFGILLPKKIGMSHPEEVAYDAIEIIDLLTFFFKPFVKILTYSTNFFMKIFRIKEHKNDKISESELKEIIIFGKQEGAIKHQDADLMMHVFEFDETDIEVLMTPIKKVVMAESGMTLTRLKEIIKESKHTRIPIYKNDRNNIIGILNVKDLILYGKSNLIIENIIKRPTYVFNDDKADMVFEEMKHKNLELVIVQNHEHKPIGVVTTEDLIKEILGDIKK